MTERPDGTVCVVGAGYVGLATVAMLLNFGHRVSVLDSDEKRVSMLRSGVPPISEPGLTDVLDRALRNDVIRFSTDPAAAFDDCTVIFVCVGTPEGPDGDADLTAVTNVLTDIGLRAQTATAVIKSSVPPGTTARLRKEFGALALAVNPEFLRQGSAIDDATNPNRIVVGTDDADTEAVLRGLYAPMTERDVPLVLTDFASAELIKYASNSFLALKVAYVNEIADLCEVTGASIDDVSTGMGLDPRIGGRFLQAGPGFGGSCFPKDTAALAAAAVQAGSPLSLVEALISSNRQRRASMSERVVNAVAPDPVSNAGVLGLTFKAGTDDTRESPAMDVVDGLIERGVAVAVFDPAAASVDAISGRANIVDSPYDVFHDADVVAVATEWPEFSELDFALAASLMAGNTIIDLRGILDRNRVEKAGLRLVAVGRP